MIIPNIPSFIDIIIDISPGIISTILTIVWSIFISLITWILCKKSYLGYGINNENLGDIYKNYNYISNISKIQWIDMIKSITEKNNKIKLRIIFMIITWTIIFIFKELFSISIINVQSLSKISNTCGGYMNEEYIFNFSNWHRAGSDFSITNNLTQVKTLLNSRIVNNITFLGDGVFVVNKKDNVFVKNQIITANRFWTQCEINSYPDILVGSPTSFLWFGKNINTTHFTNISVNTKTIDVNSANIVFLGDTINGISSDINIISSTSINNVQSIYNKFYTIYPNETTYKNHYFLITIANSYFTMFNNTDINKIQNNSFLFTADCNIHYGTGYITMKETGYLNESMINSYVNTEEKTVMLYERDNIGPYISSLFLDPNFLTIYDYPDIMINTYYNETIDKSLSYINDIFSAHMLSSVNTKLDTCFLSNQYIQSSNYKNMTKISLGYLIISITITLLIIIVIIIYTSINFNKNDILICSKYTKNWLLMYFMLNKKDIIISEDEFINQLVFHDEEVTLLNKFQEK